MTDKMEKAKKFEAEAKAIRRAEKQFWKLVDARKEEILTHFGVRLDESIYELL